MHMTTTKPPSDYRVQWLAALTIFVLAGSTGAFLRFGTIYGLAGLQFTNVRHAHSHLMYFGWVTPALMALIAAWLPRLTEKPTSNGFRYVIWIAMACGLLAYTPFLLYGYRPADIGGKQLPLSVMAAGLNVLTWYAFAWLYWQHTRGIARTQALRLWDTAVIFLIAATAGAAGLPVLTFRHIQDPFWSAAFTHIFLDLFSEGWFVLAVLGMMYAAYPQAARHPWARHSGDLIVMGLPLVFLLYMPLHLVPTNVRWVASVAGLLVVAGLVGNLWVLWTAVSPKWRIPLMFLGLKATMQLGILLPAVAQWAEINQMRIPYLHWLLLGFVTLSLFAAAQTRWGTAQIPGYRAMTAAVLLLISSLMPLTGLWPAAWGGRWVLYAAAWAALGPVTVAVAVLLSLLWQKRKQIQLKRSKTAVNVG